MVVPRDATGAVDAHDSARASPPAERPHIALWTTELEASVVGRLCVMTFEDLPEGWLSRPLRDSRLTDDVLDLVVSGRDRDQGAIHLLLCDKGDRIMQPCAVGELNNSSASYTQREIIEPFARVCRDLEPEGSLLVAIARSRGLVITDDDRGWHQAAIDVCREYGLRLLGVHVVTHSGSVRLPDYAS